MIESFPLHWPVGRSRSQRRERSLFKVSFASARDDLMRQIDLLGGRQMVLSTNLVLRLDGLPIAKQRNPDDPGVAVYFTYNKQEVCFACDRWASARENIRAVALTIEALRGIARWGTGDMLKAAFRGFAALPSPEGMKSWREVLGFGNVELVSCDAVKERWRQLRSIHHSDKGGDDARFIETKQAYEAAMAEVGHGD